MLLVLTGWGLWQIPTLLENFGTVIPGCVYRSSQLSAAGLERYTARYGLRSIINLRGSNPDDQWYQDERVAAARLGLQHYDVAVDSRYPYQDEMRELIETLEQCPRPVLMHCNSGVDRTGTMAAIALLLLDDRATLTRAEEHFGLLHLQLPWRTNAVCQRQFFDLYRQWLSQHDLAHGRAVFREWALHDYQRPVEEPAAPDNR